jgi:hypothetical protein
MPAAHHIERQIAVAIVIAVEEPPFLVAVERVVGGIDVEHDLGGRRLMRLQEERDEQALNGGRIMSDLVIARRLRSAQLKTVERRFAGHRRAVRPPCRKLVGQHRHDRIVTQLVVIVEVLIAQRNPDHPLPHQGRHAVLDQVLVTLVDKALGKAINHSDLAVRRPQQQRASVRRDRPAIKTSHNFPPPNGCKFEQFRVTLCLHRGSS